MNAKQTLIAELAALTTELRSLGVTTLAYDPELPRSVSSLRSCIAWAKETIITTKFIRAR
jgi:hypothetical protein